MKIDIDEFKKALEYMQSIDNASLEELSIYYPGNDITYKIPDSVIKEWKYIGLNNTSLIETILGDKTILHRGKIFDGKP